MNILIEHIKHWWSSYFLGALAVYYVINYQNLGLLHFPNLFIHEAGHFVFMYFGQFIYMLGGTIMQILLPLVCIYFFLRWENKLFAQIMFFWLGLNLLDIAVYVEDAKEMKLKLIGQIHDWNWILNKMGILDYDDVIAAIFIIMACLVFIIMLIVPYYIIPQRGILEDHESIKY